MVEIVVADLTDPRVLALLGEHLAEMRANSPPEAVFALDLDGLRRPELRLWTAWEGEQVVACGAQRELGPQAGEIKSMRLGSTPRRALCLVGLFLLTRPARSTVSSA